MIFFAIMSQLVWLLLLMAAIRQTPGNETSKATVLFKMLGAAMLVIVVFAPFVLLAGLSPEVTRTGTSAIAGNLVAVAMWRFMGEIAQSLREVFSELACYILTLTVTSYLALTGLPEVTPSMIVAYVAFGTMLYVCSRMNWQQHYGQNATPKFNLSQHV